MGTWALHWQLSRKSSCCVPIVYWYWFLQYGIFECIELRERKKDQRKRILNIYCFVEINQLLVPSNLSRELCNLNYEDFEFCRWYSTSPPSGSLVWVPLCYILLLHIILPFHSLRETYGASVILFYCCHLIYEQHVFYFPLASLHIPSDPAQTVEEVACGGRRAKGRGRDGGGSGQTGGGGST